MSMDTDLGGEIQVRTEQAAGRRVLHVEGELALATADRLRLVLMEDIEAGQTTVLDAGGVTALDLCGLQLLCSAHRTYRRLGASFELQATSPEFLDPASAAGCQAGGFGCPCSEDGPCIWKREGAPWPKPS